MADSRLLKQVVMEINSAPVNLRSSASQFVVLNKDLTAVNDAGEPDSAVLEGGTAVDNIVRWQPGGGLYLAIRAKWDAGTPTSGGTVRVWGYYPNKDKHSKSAPFHYDPTNFDNLKDGEWRPLAQVDGTIDGILPVSPAYAYADGSGFGDCLEYVIRGASIIAVLVVSASSPNTANAVMCEGQVTC